MTKRITPFRASVAFFVASILLVASPCAAQSGFQTGRTHQGVYETSGPKDISAPVWTFKADGPILSSAAVADGTVYVGSDDRNFYALDARNGEKKWSFVTGGIIRSSPAVVDGTVYFGSYDGFIYALCAKSGALKWKFQTGGERHFEAKGLHGMKPSTQTIPDFWDCYQSSPALCCGTLYVGSGDGNLYALDAATGEVKWKFATGDVVHTSPALAKGVVYFGSWDTNMYALDAQSGKELWRFKTGDDDQNHNRTGIQSSPTVVDGTLYFGCRDFNFYALDAATGAEKWKKNITWVNATPAVHEGRVYFGTSIPSWFFGLDAATGEEKLKLQMPMMVFSSPTIADGVAYFGCFDGSLFAVDLKEGKVLSVFKSEASKAHRADLLNEDGSFNTKSIFRNDSYEEMFSSSQKMFGAGAILSSPVLCDGTLYVGAADGSFHAFR
ncbi:MAG: PQQ-binding-like beta-propeller repeat protein [Opitutales bacterium]|jgi:outer membrane protein assembly factor BamB